MPGGSLKSLKEVKMFQRISFITSLKSGSYEQSIPLYFILAKKKCSPKSQRWKVPDLISPEPFGVEAMQTFIMYELPEFVDEKSYVAEVFFCFWSIC